MRSCIFPRAQETIRIAIVLRCVSMYFADSSESVTNLAFRKRSPLSLRACAYATPAPLSSGNSPSLSVGLEVCPLTRVVVGYQEVDHPRSWIHATSDPVLER